VLWALPPTWPPEQFRSDAVDGRCDLFGLGCILFELCTREHPFPDRHCSKEHTIPVLASDINPNVPSTLADLIGRMLREAPERRPESAQRVIRELAAIEALLTISRTKAASSVPRSKWAPVLLTSVLAIAILWALLVSNRDSSPSPQPQQKQPGSPVQTDPRTDDLCAKIRSLDGTRQLKLVVDRLVELNKGYSRKKVAGWIETEGVIRFSERTDYLHDIRPLRCLSDLKTVVLSGSDPTSGLLTDLTPLETLRLHTLVVSNNPKLQSLAPLKKMPLFVLNFSNTAVRDARRRHGSASCRIAHGANPSQRFNPSEIDVDSPHP